MQQRPRFPFRTPHSNDFGIWSLELLWSLDVGRLELCAPSPAPNYRLPTTLMSSRYLIIRPRVCNSPGGIFTTFLKIFFPNPKTLSSRLFHKSFPSKTPVIHILKNPLAPLSLQFFARS